jgi:hypothetical protein
MRTLAQPRTPVDSLNRFGRWTTGGAVLGVVAAVLALVVGLVLAFVSVMSTTSQSRTAAAPLPVPLAAPPASASDSTAASEELALPQPIGYQSGVPVGYPNTQAGAIGAAFGYSRVATGLDIPATLQAIDTMSDKASGWFPATRRLIADGLIAQRHSLGLPPAGSPGMALINVDPSAYRVDASAPGTATVLTLNTVSTESATGVMTTGTIVFRWVMRWDGTRWLVTHSFLSDADAKLAVAPYTSGAQSLGWKAARGG